MEATVRNWCQVRAKRRASANVLTVCIWGLALALRFAYSAPPTWLDDPANSKWITFGGKTGVAETNGMFMRSLTSGEGDLRPADRGGLACARSVRENGNGGYFYLKADPWDKFRAWLGEDGDVLLTVRYFDGAKGRFCVQYDSSDPRVKKPPYPAGTAPEDCQP